MKKQTIFPGTAKQFLFGFICSVFSLAAFAGGRDTYKIYLNNDLLVTASFPQSGSDIVNDLQLTGANANDQLVIYYSHCGPSGKGRSIALKDEQGNIYKEWAFADGDPAMRIAVKDILDLKNEKNKAELALHYRSTEPVAGRMLASVLAGDGKVMASTNKAGWGLPAGLAGFIVLVSIGGLLWQKRMVKA